MGSQSVCLMSHGLSSDEGDMAPCGVLEGVSRGKLHPRLGGGAGGVVVVQRGERDVAADALSGNLSRARSSEEMVRGQREGQEANSARCVQHPCRRGNERDPGTKQPDG